MPTSSLPVTVDSVVTQTASSFVIQWTQIGQNGAGPRRTVERVDLLDARFTSYGWEDNDYCRRVRMDGLQIGIFDAKLRRLAIRVCYVEPYLGRRASVFAFRGGQPLFRSSRNRYSSSPIHAFLPHRAAAALRAISWACCFSCRGIEGIGYEFGWDRACEGETFTRFLAHTPLPTFRISPLPRRLRASLRRAAFQLNLKAVAHRNRATLEPWKEPNRM
jgi:hypothetical protein